MSFFGRSFLYNGIPSETYGLYVANIDAQAINKSMGSTNMDIYEQKIYRRAQPFFYGASPSQKLQFDFSAFSENEMDADHFALVQKWLFSSRIYKQFAIDQVDMQNIYFNAILSDPQIVRVGNLIKGFECKVLCDSPFAWKYPKTITYDYTLGPTQIEYVTATEVFNNESDDTGDYLYPTLEITMNNISGGMSIENQSDSNRQFIFNNLSAGEVLTVNCLLQTIVSSTGLRRLSNFNKKFLRLVPGKNVFYIQGGISKIVMTTQYVAKKIGG